MKFAQALITGAKLVALYGAVALVVWSMPEYDDPGTNAAVQDEVVVDR